MSKKRGLNKGRVDMLLSGAVGSLLSDDKPTTGNRSISQAEQEFDISEEKGKENNLQNIAIEKLKPSPFQPRRTIGENELQELACSIEKQGMLQPIVARETKQGVEIIAGERRWRAANETGLQTVPVLMKDLTDQEAMFVALVENIQRENLSPLEEAMALERFSKELGFTHEEIAKKIGKSRASVSNLLRLLLLSPAVKNLLEDGSLEVGHAKVLLAIEGRTQEKFAEKIVEKGLSVREAEQLVQQYKFSEEKEKSTRPLDPDIARLQRSLSEKIGSSLQIQHNSKGRGKIIIKYNSIDELDGILEHIV